MSTICNCKEPKPSKADVNWCAVCGLPIVRYVDLGGTTSEGDVSIHAVKNEAQ